MVSLKSKTTGQLSRVICEKIASATHAIRSGERTSYISMSLGYSAKWKELQALLVMLHLCNLVLEESSQNHLRYVDNVLWALQRAEA